MKEMSQEEISSTENRNQQSQVIEKPCIQIFKFMKPKLEGLCKESFLENDESVSQKCPDYESDEFADVEDNTKESSDNNESTSDAIGRNLEHQDMMFLPERRDVGEQRNESMKVAPVESPDSSETDLLKNASSASHHRYNVAASCSHANDFDPKPIPDFSHPTKSEENKIKFKMPETVEVADFYQETSQKDNKSSRHKANTLKIKTKVGMRKDKCNVCRVRLGLCAIKCRCGGYYCAKHRYDKEHNCTFDYRSMGAEEIRKNNPRVIAEKVRKL